MPTCLQKMSKELVNIFFFCSTELRFFNGVLVYFPQKHNAKLALCHNLYKLPTKAWKSLDLCLIFFSIRNHALLLL